MVLDLTINSTYYGDTTTLVACDSAEWNGVLYTLSGVYSDTLQSIAGCDSILTLDLTITGPSINNITQSICNGDSILLE